MNDEKLTLANTIKGKMRDITKKINCIEDILQCKTIEAKISGYVATEYKEIKKTSEVIYQNNEALKSILSEDLRVLTERKEKLQKEYDAL